MLTTKGPKRGTRPHRERFWNSPAAKKESKPQEKLANKRVFAKAKAKTTQKKRNKS